MLGMKTLLERMKQINTNQETALFKTVCLKRTHLHSVCHQRLLVSTRIN